MSASLITNKNKEEMLAAGTCDGRIHLVDPETGVVRWAVKGYPENEIFRVAMPLDGKFVASVGCGEECWRLWDAVSGVECKAGARHDGAGACKCTVTRSGRILNEGCPVRAHSAGLHAVVFSPNGQSIATGGEDRTVTPSPTPTP